MYGLFALIRNLLLLVVVITVLRSVIGVVMKLFGGFLARAQEGLNRRRLPAGNLRYLCPAICTGIRFAAHLLPALQLSSAS